MKTTKRRLFGGALFSAGMAVNAVTANAAADQTLPFNPAGPSYAQAYFLAQPFEGLGQTDFDSYLAIGGPTAPLDLGWLNYWGSGTVHAAVTDKAIEASASWAYDPYVGFVSVSAFALSYLMPDVSTTLNLSWNVGGYGFANAYILDSAFNLVFDGASYGSSGEGMFKLEGGESYIAITVASSGEVTSPNPSGDPVFIEGSASANISVVPAPGAFALLGMAGLCGINRRRRE